jgi:hypothetical protein
MRKANGLSKKDGVFFVSHITQYKRGKVDKRLEIRGFPLCSVKTKLCLFFILLYERWREKACTTPTFTTRGQ